MSTATFFGDNTPPANGTRSLADTAPTDDTTRPESAMTVVYDEQSPPTDAHWRELRLVDRTLTSAPFADKDYPVVIRDEEAPDAFFHLFATLERLAAHQTVIGITSALGGEGKTTVALHLATSIARTSYRRVCLVDLSLGEDDLCRRVGAAPAPAGLIGFLETDRPLAALVWPGPESITLIPAGRKPANPSRSARSPRLADLIAGLRAEYDLVIVDLPAVATDNAVSLARQMDGVILVARAGATPRDVIRRAIDTLGRDLVTGIVLNRTTSGRRQLFKPGKKK